MISIRSQKGDEEMKVPLLLRMPISLKEWLTGDARKRGLTLTGLILAILNEYKDQKKERQE